MQFLPKGEPFFENVATNRLSLPVIMERLASKDFTGYLSFLFPASLTVYSVFENGGMTHILAENPCGQRWTGLDALVAITRLLATEHEGTFSAYKLSPVLAAQVRLLLRSEARIKSQQLKSTDMRGLLERMRQERFCGCLRAYGEEAVTLIFYHLGNALGFFHNGSSDLETTATTSQRIVALDNPRIDLFECAATDDLDLDLLGIINIQRLWDLVLERCRTGQATEE